MLGKTRELTARVEREVRMNNERLAEVMETDLAHTQAPALRDREVEVAELKGENVRLGKENETLRGVIGLLEDDLRCLEAEMNELNMASADALTCLWEDIILLRKPDYGDWEYPGEAYRHLMIEIGEIVEEGRKAAVEELARWVRIEEVRGRRRESEKLDKGVSGDGGGDRAGSDGADGGADAGGVQDDCGGEAAGGD